MTFDRSRTADLQRIFLELTLAAVQELDRMQTRPGFKPYFRLWDYDPLKTFRSWLIQVPDDVDSRPSEPLVLERTWDAVEDRDRLARDLRRRPRLQPTMCVREAKLPGNEFEFLREVGSKIPFPLVELRDTHLSVRPVQFGIEGFRRDTVRLRSERVRLSWGGAPHTSMKAAAAWAERMRSLCCGCFPDQDVSILRTGSTGLCALCRSAALEDNIACPACRGTYHRDCWDYVGHCAVYGCVGTAI